MTLLLLLVGVIEGQEAEDPCTVFTYTDAGSDFTDTGAGSDFTYTAPGTDYTYC
jgi:hypothetical protein